MTPQQLPASTYQEAYGSDPVGEAVSEAELGRIMDDAGALRKSKKAVKQARGRQAEAAPPMQLAVPDPATMLPGGASSSSAGPGADMARQMQMMAMMFQFFQQQQQQQQGQQAQQAEERSRGVQFSMPAQPAAKRAKALKDAAAAEPEDVTPTKDVGNMALQNQSSGDCLDDSQPPSSVKAPSSGRAPSSTSLLEVPGITPEQQAEWLREPLEDVDEAAGQSAAAKKRPAGKSSAKAKAAPKGKAKAAAKTKAQAEPKAKGQASGGGKQWLKRAARNGWEIQDRIRPTGQRDRHFVHPDHGSFRTRHEAEEHGFEE